MYKKGVVWLLVILSVLFIAACGSDSKKDNNAKGKDGDVVEIDFFHRWPNEPRKSFYDKKAQEFMDMHENVKININSVLNDPYKEKIKVQVSNDDLPDIFTSWSDSFAQDLVSSGKIMSLDDIIESDKEWSDKIISSQFSGFTFDDVTYGIPFTVDGKAFFYNKTIFEENNLTAPKTYDELLSVLDSLQQAGYDTPVVEGLSEKWAISHYLGTIFQRILDPEVMEKDYSGEGDYSDEGYVKGLEVFQELTTYMGEVSTALDHEAARNMFAAGEVPILYMQFAEVKMVEEGGDVDFGFFDFPEFSFGKGDPQALTGAPEGWMLGKDAPEEAIEFLKFLTSEETAYEFTETDGQLNAIEGAVTEENTSAISMEAYEIVTNASSTVPWFDNAIDLSLADMFMVGAQSIATNQSTPEKVMEEIRNTVKSK